MATDDQHRKVLILLILTLARMGWKKVILSPIIVAAYVRILVAAACFCVGEALQPRRAERTVTIRARRQEIRLPY